MVSPDKPAAWREAAGPANSNQQRSRAVRRGRSASCILRSNYSRSLAICESCEWHQQAAHVVKADVADTAQREGRSARYGPISHAVSGIWSAPRLLGGIGDADDRLVRFGVEFDGLSQRTSLVHAGLRHGRSRLLRRLASDGVVSHNSRPATRSVLQRGTDVDGSPTTGSERKHSLRDLFAFARLVRRPARQSLEVFFKKSHNSDCSKEPSEDTGHEDNSAGRIGQAVDGGSGEGQTREGRSRNETLGRVGEADAAAIGIGSSARADSRADAPAVSSATGHVSATSFRHVATDVWILWPNDYLGDAESDDADAVFVPLADVCSAEPAASTGDSGLGQLRSRMEHAGSAAAATDRAVAVQPTTPVADRSPIAPRQGCRRAIDIASES